MKFRVEPIPVCCGRPGKHFKKTWPQRRPFVNATMEGYYCRLCGSILYFPVDGSEYANSTEAIRLAGIAFDETLNLQPETIQALSAA